jgi:hypothetical protein
MFGDTYQMTQAAAEVRSHVDDSLHAPSFLGLEDQESSADYLLEEDENIGNAKRKWALVFLVMIVTVLGFLQWRANSDSRFLGASTLYAIKQRLGLEASKPTPAVTEPAAARDEQAVPAADQSSAQKPAEANSATAPVEDKASKASESSAGGEEPKAKAESKNAAQSAAQPAQQSKDMSSTGSAKPTENPAPKTEQQETAKLAPAEPSMKRGKTPAAITHGRRSETRTRVPAAVASEPRDDGGDELVTRAQNYLYGRGVPRNCQTAVTLLQSAAEHGNPRASTQLGAMYATGNCAPFDRATAYRWLTRAASAQPRNMLLERNRQMLWRDMSPDERNRALR